MTATEPLVPVPAGDGGQAAVLLQLAGLQEAVAQLAARVGATEDALEAPAVPGYRPIPAHRWWELDGETRDAPIARLRAWVRDVYAPGYGHLARRLGPCWARHDLCLYVLDLMSELHSVLYLRKHRTPAVLNGQAEYTLRLLPAAADLMETETRGCRTGHAQAGQ